MMFSQYAWPAFRIGILQFGGRHKRLTGGFAFAEVNAGENWVVVVLSAVNIGNYVAWAFIELGDFGGRQIPPYGKIFGVGVKYHKFLSISCSADLQ
jgi:hypothetical protein